VSIEFEGGSEEMRATAAEGVADAAALGDEGGDEEIRSRSGLTSEAGPSAIDWSFAFQSCEVPVDDWGTSGDDDVDDPVEQGRCLCVSGRAGWARGVKGGRGGVLGG